MTNNNILPRNVSKCSPDVKYMLLHRFATISVYMCGVEGKRRTL